MAHDDGGSGHDDESAEATHLRFDVLAVGHVLGGLDAVDSAIFRDHLPGCRTCRSRVAELRSMASDMEAAARDERSRQLVVTQAPRRTDPNEEAARAWRFPSARGVLAAVLAVTLGLGLLAWMAHVRGQNEELLSVTSVREATLEALGRGAAVDARTHDGVSGVVSATAERIAWSFSGLPTLAGDEALVIWLIHPDPQQSRFQHYTGRELSEGRFAGTIERFGADSMVVTVERLPIGGGPSTTRLVEADLTAAPAHE